MKPSLPTMTPAEEAAWRAALLAPDPHAGERYCRWCDAWIRQDEPAAWRSYGGL